VDRLEEIKRLAKAGMDERDCPVDELDSYERIYDIAVDRRVAYLTYDEKEKVYRCSCCGQKLGTQDDHSKVAQMFYCFGCGNRLNVTGYAEIDGDLKRLLSKTGAGRC
jgi:DNA-directed RNA polymerase subunit RPC12/RpoP